MIERNIALEARLIDDLLDLTRISRGRLHLRPEACDAHSLIALAADIIRDEVREKQLTLDFQLSAVRSGVTGDPARLQQVFWNLLRNAVKFTPAGGQISIRTSDVPPDWLRVEVNDTGIGIPAEMVERIFTPFEQGALEKSHRFGGLGLGLAIARMLVNLHGGKITAESAGRGEGAKFIVELPGTILPVAIHPAPHLPPGTEPPDVIPPMSLLLVEDHEATLQVLQRLLMRSGHRVTTASTVAAALAAAASARFDVVVSDLGLPDGTGIELMEQLRDRYQLRGIALTGYGMEEDLRRSQEAGFIMHLVKPVDFQHLRRALRSIYETR
jgi:CheY-like chemotaxis protein